MLQVMRKHAKFFYFLFFIVILSFVFWGVGSLDKPTSVIIAEIGKERITVEEYWKAFDRMRETYKEIFKDQFNEEMEKKLKLKETVLNSLVDEKVLLMAARDAGFAVTDKELQDIITADQRFMRDGVFRKDVYFKTMELSRLTPDMFENSLRQQILLQKMRMLVTSVIDVTPYDLKETTDDQKKQQEMKQTTASNLKSAAMKSYVDSIKQKMKIKINMELLS